MRSSDILLNLTTDDFRTQAFADYLKKCSEDYANLVSSIAEAAADDNDDDLDIDTRVSQFCIDHDYDTELIVTFNEGYVKYSNLIKMVMQTTDADADNSINETTGEVVLQEKTLQVRDIEDRYLGVKLSYMDIVDQMSENLRSATCAAAALYASYKTSVSDRLTYFKEFIANSLNLENISESPTYMYFKNLLLDVDNGSQSVGANILNVLGIFKRTEPDDSGLLSESDLVQFTGATPVPCLDFSSVVSGTITVVRTVCNTVKGIVKSLWNLAKPVFSKIVKSISDVVNVNDITVLNGDGVPSCDGWVYEDTKTTEIIEVPSGTAAQFFNKYGQRWMKFETVFGEILYCLNSVSGDNWNITIKIKPYVVDPVTVSNIFSIHGFAVSNTGTTWTIGKGTTTHYSDLAETMADIVALGEQAYIPDNNVTYDENYYYNGLKFSITILHWIMKYGLDEMIDGTDAGYSFAWNSLHGGWSMALNTSTITNKDWIQEFSGWNGNTTTPEFSGRDYGYLISDSSDVNSWTMGWIVFMMLYYQYDDRIHNVTDWTFLPYRDNVANFKPSKYRIKTDRENQSALDTFVNVIATVVIIAVVAITCASIIHVIKKKIFWKRYKTVGTIDQKIWNGQSLTSAEMRKYRRYQKKLNASNYLSSSLSSSQINPLQADKVLDASGVYDSVDQVQTIANEISHLIR